MKQALNDCEPLARLQARLADASARMDVIRPLLPAALQACVRPGPPDDEGWTLLVPSAAVGAKLRQLAPRLQQALLTRGWQSNLIRIRIQS
jgi:hypothetical protein